MRISVSILLLIVTLTAIAQDYRTLCNEGIKHIADRKYREAASSFKKATELSNSEQEKTYAYANLAYSQQMCGDLEKALKSYNIAIGDDTDKIALMLQRANILLQLDSLDKALNDYNHILRQEPTNSSALFFRANIYTELDKYDKAKEDYLRLLSLEPNNDNVKLGLALLYKRSLTRPVTALRTRSYSPFAPEEKPAEGGPGLRRAVSQTLPRAPAPSRAPSS